MSERAGSSDDRPERRTTTYLKAVHMPIYLEVCTQSPRLTMAVSDITTTLRTSISPVQRVIRPIGKRRHGPGFIVNRPLGLRPGAMAPSAMRTQSDIVTVMEQDQLTLVEVAERTGTSKVTARRYLDANRFPNAIREDGRADGRWLVPWSDVVASGLARKKLLGSPAPDGPDGTAWMAEAIGSMARTIEAQSEVIKHLTALLHAAGTEIEESHDVAK